MTILSLLVILYSAPQKTNGITLDQLGSVLSTAGPIVTHLWDTIFVMEEKPQLLLRYHDGRKARQNVIKWDNVTKDPSKSPLSYVLTRAERLIRGRDLSRCEMQYYDDPETPIAIFDDDSILEILEAGADMSGNKRLIDIVCEDIPPPPSPDVAIKAYNYATMENTKINEDMKIEAEKKLKAAKLGSYSLTAEGIQIIGADSKEFASQISQISAAYGFDKKTESIMNAMFISNKVFQSRKAVRFSAEEWKIVGFFVRFAGWKSDVENNKSSVFIAVSKFEFTIPSDQREGNMLEKLGWGSGGAISQEYIDYIYTVIKDKARTSSKEDLDKPELQHNHTDL